MENKIRRARKSTVTREMLYNVWAETDYRPDVSKYIAREFWPHKNV